MWIWQIPNHLDLDFLKILVCPKDGIADPPSRIFSALTVRAFLYHILEIFGVRKSQIFTQIMKLSITFYKFFVTFSKLLSIFYNILT